MGHACESFPGFQRSVHFPFRRACYRRFLLVHRHRHQTGSASEAGGTVEILTMKPRCRRHELSVLLLQDPNPFTNLEIIRYPAKSPLRHGPRQSGWPIWLMHNQAKDHQWEAILHTNNGPWDLDVAQLDALVLNTHLRHIIRCEGRHRFKPVTNCYSQNEVVENVQCSLFGRPDDLGVYMFHLGLAYGTMEACNNTTSSIMAYMMSARVEEPVELCIIPAAIQDSIHQRRPGLDQQEDIVFSDVSSIIRSRSSPNSSSAGAACLDVATNLTVGLLPDHGHEIQLRHTRIISFRQEQATRWRKGLVTRLQDRMAHQVPMTCQLIGLIKCRHFGAACGQCRPIVIFDLCELKPIDQRRDRGENVSTNDGELDEPTPRNA
jgi:hypothetical protein